jgi:hypothetical protein
MIPWGRRTLRENAQQRYDTLETAVQAHETVERQPSKERAFGVPIVVMPEPKAATQLQLFSTDEPQNRPLKPYSSDEQLPDDLLGMYYFG